MCSCGSHRRQRVDPGQHVVVVGDQPGQLERGRDEDRPAEPDARIFLEHAHEASDSIAAVAFACDEDGRSPPAVLREPASHELAQRLEVALQPEVLLRIGRVVLLVVLLVVLRHVALLGLDHTAEPCSDGIDEHEVGELEPRRLVLHESRWHFRERAVRRKGHALRADHAEVQIRRRGSRTAVEDEHHRPIAGATRGDVRDGQDLRSRFLLLAQHQPLRARHVVDRCCSARPVGGRRRARGRRAQP